MDWDGPIVHQALSRNYSLSKEASKSGVNLYLVGDFWSQEGRYWVAKGI